MIGPEFQKAQFAALHGATDAGANVFDQVPESNPFPRITIGDEQVIDDTNTCQAAWEVFSDVHCWSRPESGSKIEVKTIAAQVVTAMLGITTIAGFTLVAINHQTTRFFRDPDGLTEHAVVSFRALIDPA
ncbi:DUF3168 domain-containing protein [Mesorhizobium sp.]|uniref:DUF3168 domain-containing protein n=1 Tax=Mesorhizobium sp. TaxID=1871066 RepID=UPI000FE63DDF|nr:DUF3168 domain-containing protein [Mesorhizobium sp.]RWE75252.1 MAG: DUF3168 domain-containing protein [Mesorhizobium sp.]